MDLTWNSPRCTNIHVHVHVRLVNGFSYSFLLHVRLAFVKVFERTALHDLVPDPGQ